MELLNLYQWTPKTVQETLELYRVLHVTCHISVKGNLGIDANEIR